ncbi:MAG: ABC transporter ATP-binding protein [Pseudomonadota bacterium]|nr:ABC transporter ATP-binding protein [Pseudomonadota bacterium]
MVKPLSINKLVKNYGALRAVDQVTFDIPEGQIFGLLGPNGAGKTTVIAVTTTLADSTSGFVEVFGVDVAKNPKLAKTYMGVVHQELVNQGFFNVEEILHIYSGYHGILKNHSRIEFLLEKLGLVELRKKPVKFLSGGMKRRLMIAKALVHWPMLLLLDEPTAGVDVELRRSLWEFMRELKNLGMTILLTTHYLEEAEQLCDRVGIINKGKLIKVGPTQDLIRELTQREVKFTLVNPIDKIKNQFLTKQNGKELIFEIPSSHQVGELLCSLNIPLLNIADIKVSEGTLEEAFRRVLEGGSSFA